eukprot:1065727-Rhodomonas_salina.1
MRIPGHASDVQVARSRAGALTPRRNQLQTAESSVPFVPGRRLLAFDFACGAVCLRRCYAMPATDLWHARTPPSKRPLSPPSRYQPPLLPLARSNALSLSSSFFPRHCRHFAQSASRSLFRGAVLCRDHALTAWTKRVPGGLSGGTQSLTLLLWQDDSFWRGPSGSGWVVKLADYGTVEVDGSTLGKPLCSHHVTTWENAPVRHRLPFSAESLYGLKP